MNSVMGLSFKVFFAEKSICGSCEQCTRDPLKNARDSINANVEKKTLYPN